jgi:hypothetical protein
LRKNRGDDLCYVAHRHSVATPAINSGVRDHSHAGGPVCQASAVPSPLLPMNASPFEVRELDGPVAALGVEDADQIAHHRFADTTRARLQEDDRWGRTGAVWASAPARR